MQYIWEEGPFAKEELLNHAIELFQIIRVERDRREKFGSRKLCPIIISVHNFLWAMRSGFPTTNFRNHSPSWPLWLSRWHEDKSEYKNKRLILWRTIHSYSVYWMNKRHLRTTWNWLVLRQRIVTKVRLASCCRPGISQKLSYFKVITNMTVTTVEGVQSGLAKNFFCQKTFDEIWERQKQNMWAEGFWRH